MWVYRKITFAAPGNQKGDLSRWEVGYYAPLEGEEYGKMVHFHCVALFENKDDARREVHYLNGGQF